MIPKRLPTAQHVCCCHCYQVNAGQVYKSSASAEVTARLTVMTPHMHNRQAEVIDHA